MKEGKPAAGYDKTEEQKTKIEKKNVGTNIVLNEGQESKTSTKEVI